MQIWFKMDLTQSHLRTSSDFLCRLSFSFNRADTSSFAHSVHSSGAALDLTYPSAFKSSGVLIFLVFDRIRGGPIAPGLNNPPLESASAEPSD
jgi:hypothetical protein